MTLIIHSVTIITLEQRDDIFQGYVVIEDHKFTKVAKGSPTEEEQQTASRILDGKGKWLMPGLVNTHGHLGSALLRGAGDDMPLMTWLKQVMWPNEAQFDHETVLTAVKVAMMEMIKSGTTTFLDMYHLHMSDIAEIVIEKNLRAVLCRGMIGQCSQAEQEKKLAESTTFFKNYHGEGEGRVSIALSPHAPYTCPPAFLKRVAETAGKHHMMIHTHVSETRNEVDKHVSEYGIRPILHLKELGIFEHPVLLAHAVHVDETELTIIKEAEAAISHNPISNLKLGSGIAPLKQFHALGITVSLGTDSTASNNNLDLFEEMRMAALLHKGVNEDPTVTNAFDILKMATSQGATSLQIENTGVIAPGYQADFILINPATPHLTPNNEGTIMSHLVYSCKGSDVTDVFINGSPVYENEELQLFDEEKLLFNANLLAKKFI
ncbi:amidohydrolase [Salipaludibacillus agaradhaerens]|uniref:5-methylthioadenosine/S-adenosylhomocysteine deaminase n=1 Tax=Salipaludibacillus agaradhaerens TaxID=76935 RepID=A0A9Q4FYU3_SALAG|nr:amidohydrolase [Salipaludibacillus agaradhaerens]MCR6096482.1 amidohydrolase [Salipaludibacillus agaradhaerens]MCR6113959.1 amidohydrolase [Salipaludibacillus agaradhaerens]